jgi:hypothetical protein
MTVFVMERAHTRHFMNPAAGFRVCAVLIMYYTCCTGSEDVEWCRSSVLVFSGARCSGLLLTCFALAPWLHNTVAERK